MAAKQHDSIFQTGFFSHIILPTVLTICLFVFTLFVLLIPAIENTILDRKREMTRELVHTAWSVLEELEAEERQGQLTQEEAQQRAIDRIGFMRYGAERKDYFWIQDMRPTMIVHPYRPELNGQDMTDYEDPSGKRLFVACVEAVQDNGEGYVEYMWQWKDDETRIVPKLSFVKRFGPWDWIIGTGIYVEDVKEEISSITRWFLTISLSITAIISLLLAFVAYQSLTIVKRRRQAEAQLLSSHEKYKTLVEATTEGLVMIVDDCVFFANQTFLDMLGYTHNEIEHLAFQKLIPADVMSGHEWKAWLNEQSSQAQFPSQLLAKDDQPIDVMLSTSNISFSDKNATILIAKDVTLQPSLKPEEDSQTGGYEPLLRLLNLGWIRAFAGKKGTVFDANPTAASIFGYSAPDELHTVPFMQLLQDPDDIERISHELHDQETVVKRVVQIKQSDGDIRTIQFSAFANHHEESDRPCFDAIIEDITERLRIDHEQEGIIAELQSCLIALNQPIRGFIREVVSCPMNETIQHAVEQMTRHGASAILVQSESGDSIGIVTNRDICDRVLSEHLDPATPIVSIMSAPLHSVDEHTLIYEAALKVREKKIHHLVAKDSTGAISGIITDGDLLQFHQYSSAIMIKSIENAHSLDDVIEESQRLPSLVKSLIDGGANTHSVTRSITKVSDSVLSRIGSIMLNELGPPPVRFAFMALGSEGREEQTLFTDQDNAIIYDDEAIDDAQSYFQQYGERTCTYLNQAGYTFCQGDVMAMNHRWCQPLSVWKGYFSDWIQNADPQALLDLKIFFDCRCMIGEESFVVELINHIHQTSHDKAAFFHHLAANTLLIKPPLGMFGNIVAKSKDGGQQTFDSKEAMLPLVDFARIYALKNHIHETSTIQRLQRITEKGALTKTAYENSVHSYECLMRIRLKHQAEAYVSERQSNNQIDPKSLTEIEHAMVIKALSHISDLQTKMSYDFTGTAT